MVLNSPAPRRLLICGCSIAAFVIASASAAQAQFVSKSNNTDPLNSGTSWIGGIAPDATTIAQWDSAITAANASPLGGNVSWLGIKVTNPAGPITIDVGGTLTLGKSGIDMSAATQDLTINAPVAVGNGRQIWNVAAGRALTLATAPTKAAQPNNTGVLQIGTTGTVKLGTATTNLIFDSQNNPWVTYGLNDWAGLNAGTVVPSTYTDASTALTAGAVNDITGDFNINATVDIQAVRFNDPIARTINVSTSGTSRTFTARGILVTPNSGGGTIGGSANSSFIRPSRVSTAVNTPFNVIQHSAADFTIGANISNASSGAPVQLVKSGVGKLILTNNNAYTGGTTIHEGTLQVGAGAAIGALGGGDVTNNGALVFNRSDVVTVTNNIYGTGSVTQAGPGELIFMTNLSTYSGATNINGGTLTFTTPENLGTGTAINFNGGTLKWAGGNTADVSTRTLTIGGSGATVDTNGNNVVLANPIGAGGAGSLTKAGTGTLTLGAANTYTGGTQVNGGMLLVANTTGSATGTGPVTVNGGATLAGTGIVGGVATINSSGLLSPAASAVGTLTLGGLTLSSGSLLSYDFNATSRDLVTVTGTNGLTLNGGAFSLFNEGTPTGWSTPGSYNLLSFAGGIQGTGVSSLSVANPVAGFNYTFGTSGNFVTLTIAAAGVMSNWRASGGGSWGTAGNWSNGVPNQADATANFGSTITAPATVTLDGNKAVGAITFNSAQSYTIATGTGGSLTFQKTSGEGQGMVVTGSHTISAPVVLNSELVADVAAQGTLNLSGAVSGAQPVTKTGAGTLALSGSNTYSGGTKINSGTLQFSSLASLGTGNITISGATLRWATGNTADISSRTVNFGIGGATLDTNGNDVTLNASVGGVTTGGLTKAGAGTLTLAADNAYTGATSVTGGTLAISSNGALGDPATGAGITLNGGALRALVATTLDNGGVNARPVTIGSSGGTLDVPDFSILTVPGLISGAGALTKTGPGALIVTNNANNYSGTVLAGGNFTLGSNVNFGTGGLGPGQVIFQGGTLDHAYGGNNTLVYDVTTPMSVAEGQTGTLVTPNRFRLNSAVTGGGTLNLTVSSTVTRADLQNDFSGFTGTLNINGSGGIRLGVQALGSGQPNFNAAGWANTTLVVDNVNIIAQTNSFGNTVQVGALSSTGPNGILGGTFNAGSLTWQIGAKNLDTNYQGTIVDGTSPTNVTKVGVGTLTLSGLNTYTGTTTVTEGTLLVSGGISSNVALTGGKLQMGANDVLGDTGNVNATFGTLSTGGFSDTLGTLAVGGPFTIDLGAASSVLRFANSSANLWLDTLNIENWSGLLTGGGADRLFFGTDATGLTADQVRLIQFTNPAGFAPGVYPAQILASGEIVAVPEPASLALLALGAGLLTMRRRHR